MPAPKKKTEGDIVMHVHEKIAEVTVKRTVKIGENYESREVRLQKGVNGSPGEAYETIIETERALSEMLDDMFGDMVFEKEKTPKEKVEEAFGDVEELEIAEPEEEVFDPDAPATPKAETDEVPSFFPIVRDIWYRKSQDGTNIKVKGFNGGRPWPDNNEWEEAVKAVWKWQKTVAPGKIAEWTRDKRQYAYTFWQKIYRHEFGEDFVPRS